MADVPICPYCRRRSAAPEFLPFCGERCKMADLGRWLGGDYRVADASSAGHPSPPASDPDADTGDAGDPAH